MADKLPKTLEPHKDLINDFIEEYFRHFSHFYNYIREKKHIMRLIRVKEETAHLLAALFALYIGNYSYVSPEELYYVLRKIYKKFGKRIDRKYIPKVMYEMAKRGWIIPTRKKGVYMIDTSMISFLEDWRATALNRAEKEKTVEEDIQEDISRTIEFYLSAEEFEIPRSMITYTDSGILFDISPLFLDKIVRHLRRDVLFTYKKLIEMYINNNLVGKNPDSDNNIKKISTEQIRAKAEATRLVLKFGSNDLSYFSKEYLGYPKQAFAMEGVIVSYTQPSFLWLFDGVICEKNHISLVHPNTAKNYELCPIEGCGAKIADTFKYKIPGVETVFESVGETGIKKSLLVFIPLPMWKIFEKEPSSKKILLLAELPREAFLPLKSVKSRFIAIGYFPVIKEFTISLEESEKITSLSKKPTWKIIKMISDTVFPHLTKIYHGKIASILTAFSQGVDKIKLKHREMYGPIYTLLIGAPQTGKSELLKATMDFANPVFFRNAIIYAGSASRAGISLSYDKETRGLRYGIEPLNHRRIVAYDELDKALNKDDLISQLNDIMSSFTAKYTKAGTTPVAYPAVSAKLFAANLPGNLLQIQDVDDLINAIKNGYAGEETSKSSPLFGKATDPFITRIDFLAFFPKPISVFDMKNSPEEALLEPLDKNIPLKYIQYLHDNILSQSEYTEIPDDVYEYMLDSLVKLLDKYRANPFVKLLSAPRRVNTILKVARTIAHMHLRKEITFMDIDEAIAFTLYIHTYPFLEIVPKDIAKEYLKPLEEYLNILGDYYILAKSEVESKVEFAGEVYEAEKPEPLLIKSEKDFSNYVTKRAKQLGTFTFEELIKVIKEDIYSKRIIFSPGSKLNRIMSSQIFDFDSYLYDLFELLNGRGVFIHVGSNRYQVVS